MHKEMKKLIVILTAVLGWTMPTQVMAQNMQPATVVEKAMAPTWVVQQRDSDGIAIIDPLAAQLIWTQPVLPPLPNTPLRTTYTLRIVEVMPQQQPDVAIERNPVVYQKKGLLTPQFIMPRNLLRRDLQAGHLYVTQVTAQVEPMNKPATPIPAVPFGQNPPTQPAMGAQHAAQGNAPTTSQLIQNDGRSELLLFRLKE